MFDNLFGKPSSISAIASIMDDSKKFDALIKLVPLLKDLAITPEQVTTIMGLAHTELGLPEFFNSENPVKTFGELFKVVELLLNHKNES